MQLTTTPYFFSAFQAAPAGVLYEREFLTLVASVETRSEHLLAKAVSAIARKNNFPLYPVIGFKEFPGSGLGGAVEVSSGIYRAVVIGNRRFIQKEIGLSLPETLEAAARRWENEGARISLAGWDGWVRGVLKFTPETTLWNPA